MIWFFACVEKYGPSPILELGAATGALSVYLSAPPFNFKISTRYCNKRCAKVLMRHFLYKRDNNLIVPLSHQSFQISDIDDGGEVEENIYHNFELNGLPRVLHIPHSWGTGEEQ